MLIQNNSGQGAVQSIDIDSSTGEVSVGVVPQQGDDLDVLSILATAGVKTESMQGGVKFHLTEIDKAMKALIGEARLLPAGKEPYIRFLEEAETTIGQSMD